MSCYDSVTVSQHSQYQDPQSEASKWNPAIIDPNIYTCASPAANSLKMFSVKKAYIHVYFSINYAQFDVSKYSV